MTQNYSEIPNFICIQYPGVVNNPEKAIQTLGGIKTISNVYSSSNLRMMLRFRPGEPYCKSTNSIISKTAGLLLKVRIKKKKSNGESPKILSTSIAAIVREQYEFESLSDFQYLPLVSKDENTPETSGLRSIQDDLLPTGIPNTDWLNLPCPYFLVPAMFSRMDIPQNYSYCTSNIRREKNKQIQKSIILGRNRKKRLCHAIYVPFSHTDPIPLRPNKNALNFIKSFEELVGKIKKLFDMQPIWSKSALAYVSKMSDIQLKAILPSVAYYYLTGPWRIMWVKFGCDPRKDPSSKIYQSIDFRVRNAAGMKEMIKPRSSSYLKKRYQKQEKLVTPSNTKKENIYLFRPGVLPPRRQIFYQYCNLKVPEIVEMIGRLGEVLPGALCHERRGWLPPGFEEQCREILNRYVSETIKLIISEKYQSNDASCSVDDDDIFEEGVEGSNADDNQNEDENVEADDGILSEDEYDEELDFEDVMYQDNEADIDVAVFDNISGDVEMDG